MFQMSLTAKKVNYIFEERLKFTVAYMCQIFLLFLLHIYDVVNWITAT